MRVKICGITSLKDATMAIDNGADAIGFVFYEKSPRYIDPSRVKEIIDDLPPFVEKVGLFVNADFNYVNSVMANSGLTLAQLHFEVDENYLKELKYPCLRVIRAKSREDLLEFKNEYRLVDAYVSGYGGEGKRLDLSWFNGIDCSKIILAGGLHSDMLEELKPYNFYGVDVSSYVEKEKGIKDEEKVRKFIKRVKV